MATKEDQETLRLLVQHVSRAFYDPKYIIVMDQLARHPVLKDDELAGRMGLQPKELNKLIAVLSSDQLIKVYRQNELKEGAQRAVGRQYYYIDYEHFCNVVKWRIAKMRTKIDSNLRNELHSKGYICPQCKTSYSPLDVDKLMDFARGCLICEICHAEVVDNENAESALGSNDRMQRFIHQVRFIRAGLQKSESMVLPHFDIAGWVAANRQEASSAKSTSGPGAGLKIAGSDPNSKTEDAGVGVLLTTDKDEATRILERNQEAELKRQQNALPAWHLKSTITGDLTALGLKEQARVEQQQQILQQHHSMMNGAGDGILKGLGVVGQRAPPKATPQPQITVVEETKPAVNQEADYYDQYYASLAASAAASAQATPSAISLPIHDFDDAANDEEEDRKPSMEYLNSLNDYRKRSRSREDEGEGSQSKIVKSEEAPSFTNGSTAVPHANGVDYEMGAVDDMAEDMSPTEPEDDPIIYVNGKPVPYSKVTEEDHELMTPEEYTTFFEVMQTRS